MFKNYLLEESTYTTSNNFNKTTTLNKNKNKHVNKTDTINTNQICLELQNLEVKCNPKEEEEFLLKMKNNAEVTQASGKIENLFFSREEASVEFNIKYFFKFLIYHFIFFFLLGPIFGLILIPIEGYNMVRHMGFLGFNFIFFYQFLLYIAAGPNLFSNIFFLYYNVNKADYVIYLGFVERLFCNLAIFIRCLIIAFRYAYTTKSQLKKRYLEKIPNSDREYLISGWRNVDTETIDLEAAYSFIRQKIDVEMFKINLFSEMQKEWMERFTKDDYYEAKDERVFRQMYSMERKNKWFEKKLKEEMIKYPFNMKMYAKMKPFLNTIKKEKELAQLPFSRKDTIITTNDFIDNERESYIKINTINRNGKLEKQREKESYKNLIKKIAKQFNAISKSESRISKYSLPKELLPYYLRTPSINTLFFDFPGRILLREILYLSRLRAGNCFIYFISSLILLHSFIPVISRHIRSEPAFGANLFEGSLIIINIIVFVWVLFYTILLIEIGGIDYKRKLFFMKVLSSVITPDKSEFEQVFKILPTINFFVPNNIKSWMYCRRLCIDVGLRYTKRVESYASCIFFIYFIFVVVLLLGNFKIISNFSLREYPVLFLMGYTEAFVLSIVIFRMMLLGKKLNDYFNIHKSELTCIKTSIKEILSNWEIFLDMTTYVNPYLTKAKDYYALCKEYYKVTSKEKIEEDKLDGKMIPQNDEEFKSNLEKVVESIDDTIEQIELEEVARPVKLMGFKLTSDFMAQFYICVIGMLYSLFQYVVETYVLEK